MRDNWGIPAYLIFKGFEDVRRMAFTKQDFLLSGELRAPRVYRLPKGGCRGGVSTR